MLPGSKIVSRHIGPHQAEIGYQQMRFSRHRDMEAEHIHRIASPGDYLAVRGKLQVHQVGDGASWRMISRNPFGVHEIHGMS